MANNAGSGLVLASNAAWSGAVRNSIVWNNAGGNFAPPVASGQVHASCGGFAGINGNIDTDPLLASQTELTLSTASPCINAADLPTGVSVARDHLEASRVCDWDYTNVVRPDMGAYELAGNRLRADLPWPRIGETIGFSVSAIGAGDNGPVALFLGFQDATLFVPPYGVVTAGVATLVPIGNAMTWQNMPLPIPAVPFLIGAEIAVQAVAVPARLPAQGNLTNLYRARLLAR